MIRSRYVPATATRPSDTNLHWVQKAVWGELNADQLLQHDCRWIYEKVGSYDGAA